LQFGARGILILKLTGYLREDFASPETGAPTATAAMVVNLPLQRLPRDGVT